MLLRDADISTEYPADVDDENINEQGFSPALPGELTKVSSALVLFRMSRILSKTLEHLYPAGASYSISLKKLHSLSDELDQWHEELPDHLRLRFCNDKPATNLISDRSPLLSLAYFHTRSLIHRPLLCHGSGSAASAATIVLAAAAKHIAQIVDLLDERCMNYTFPVNKQDLLLNAGFSILWQCMDLEDYSKLFKDNQKSLTLLLAKISKENNAAASEFQKVASAFALVGSHRAIQPKHIPTDTPAPGFLDNISAPVATKQKTAKKQLLAIASRFSGYGSKVNKSDEGVKRRTTPPQTGLSQLQSTNSTVSLASIQSAPAMQVCTSSPRTSMVPRPIAAASSVVNLDYFPVEGTQNLASQNSSSTMLPPKKHSAPSSTDDWKQLVPDFETSVLYNTVEPTALNKCLLNPETADWTEGLWDLTGFTEKAHVPQSLLSFSEESLTSGDDFVFSTAGSLHGSMSTHDGVDFPNGEEKFKGITMPVSSIEDELDFTPSVQA